MYYNFFLFYHAFNTLLLLSMLYIIISYAFVLAHVIKEYIRFFFFLLDQHKDTLAVFRTTIHIIIYIYGWQTHGRRVFSGYYGPRDNRVVRQPRDILLSIEISRKCDHTPIRQ